MLIITFKIKKKIKSEIGTTIKIHDILRRHLERYKKLYVGNVGTMIKFFSWNTANLSKQRMLPHTAIS